MPQSSEPNSSTNVSCLSGVLKQFYVTHWGLLLTAGIGVCALVALWNILAPFVAALTLACLLADPSRWVYKRFKGRMPLSVCAVAVFLGLIVLLACFALLFIPVLNTQLDLIESNLPQLLKNIRMAVVPWLQGSLGWSWSTDDVKLGARVVELMRDHRALLTDVGTSLVRSGSASVLGFTGFVSLMGIATLFILPGWLSISASVRQLFPPRVWERMSPLMQEIDTVLIDYLKGMLLLVVCLSAYYAVGLSVVGLQSGWAIGLLTGLLCVVPYLGFLIAMLLAVLTSALELQGVWPVVWVLLVFGLGQLLESFVLTPWLVGDKIGLSAISVMFALALFGALFGLVGVVLALPLAAIFKVGYVHLFRWYSASVYYRRKVQCGQI